MSIQETRVALRNVGALDPHSIDTYLELGGYAALKKARAMDANKLIDGIEKVGKLRGRGGAGFNTGLKWSGAAQASGDVKYVICNADEGEPGTFKDRVIMEGDPHTVIEGMLICCAAIGAREGFIYCRGEYQGCQEILREAIAQMEERGLAGGVKLKVASGAGSYVCGEETTLLNSLEGVRAEPRLKPPFPTVSGFRSCPTVVNNVETFATVPVIVERGPAWFAGLGAQAYPGTKVLCLSGDVVNRGVFEVETDVSLRDVIYGLAGVPEGHRIKAVQMGGSSCAFMRPEDLDTPIDFDSLRAHGASLGSGSVLVMDDSHDMVDVALRIASFFAHESCGKCAPCREGTYRAAELMGDIAAGKGSRADLEQLRLLSRAMGAACFCPLGQGALVPIMSALELFPEDFAKRMGA